MPDERKGVSCPDGQQAGDGTLYLIYDYDRRKPVEICFAAFREADITAADPTDSAVRLQRLIRRKKAASG